MSGKDEGWHDSSTLEDEKVLPARGSGGGGPARGLAGVKALAALGQLNPASTDLEKRLTVVGGVTARGASHRVEKGQQQL